jgi:hypothetical protein
MQRPALQWWPPPQGLLALQPPAQMAPSQA